MEAEERRGCHHYSLQRIGGNIMLECCPERDGGLHKKVGY